MRRRKEPIFSMRSVPVHADRMSIAGRASSHGFAQVILSLGVFLVLLALWGTWTGYVRVEQTRSTIQQVVTQGLASGMVLPVSQGGGYETESYGGSQVPQLNMTGVVAQAAHVARVTVPSSQTTAGNNGYTWTLSAADQPRWDLAGSIVVQNVTLSTQRPYRLTATVTAPMQVSLWGIATIPATLHLAIVVPVMGQKASRQFQSY